MSKQKLQKEPKQQKQPKPQSESRFKIYSFGEEVFNSISHGVGVLLAIAALVTLIVRAVTHGDGHSLASALVYGISLILLYTMSMVYHIVQGPRAKKVLRIFDHCSIFILIAGTYTPYLLCVIRGALGWTIFGIIWGVTLMGVLMNSLNLEKFRVFSLICYILMGWGVIATIKPIATSIPVTGTVFLVVGGLIYTIGIIFYSMKKYRYMHSVWHLFVLGGSIFHYFSILLYVL